jgi:hypothetical protein
MSMNFSEIAPVLAPLGFGAWLGATVLFAGCGGAVQLDDVPIGGDGGTTGPGNPGAPGAIGTPGTPGSPGAPIGTGTTTPGGPSGPPTVVDASAPPPLQTIVCGDQSCTAGVESCCFDPNGDASCIAKGATCQGFPLDCSSGQKSCGSGEACCLDLQDQSASCVPKDQCSGAPSPNGGQIILCDSDADCRQGERCRDAPGDFGIKICRPRRGGDGSGGGGGFGGN